jgi:hypothetical protein
MSCSIRSNAEGDERPSTGDPRSVKISIDSNEPLEDVLRVVGAAYDVTLSVAPGETTEGKAARFERSRGRLPRSGQGRETSRKGSDGPSRSTKHRLKVTNAELRSWARENGHAVNDRGRVPAAVIAAYRQAR